MLVVEILTSRQHCKCSPLHSVIFKRGGILFCERARLENTYKGMLKTKCLKTVFSCIFNLIEIE